MKKLILAASALVFGTAAQAADLPSSKVPPPAPIAAIPAFTWTGFYLGANAGYNWGGDGGKWYNYCGNAACPVWADANPNYYWWNGVPNGDIGSQDGWEFGVQAGYNYQMGSFVIGIEGDINWLGGDKQRSWAWSGNYSKDGPVDQKNTDYPVIAYGKGEMNWLGTLRARFGFAADHFLIYGTGGLAFGNVSGSAGLTGQCWGSSVPGTDACDKVSLDNKYQSAVAGYNNFSSVAGSKSGTRVGWTLGLGAEYAITNNWTVKGEWLYYDLGSNNFSTTGTTYIVDSKGSTAWYTPNIRRDVTGNLARLGVNYKF
jgi:outer membrane immunogenic protein